MAVPEHRAYSQYKPTSQTAAYGLEPLIISLVTASIEFSWVMFFTALAASKLNFSRKYLQTANQAVLPVYILHQSVIVVFGYFIINISASPGMKFLMLAALAIPFSLLLFLVIRKSTVLRFVFGMKSEVTVSKQKKQSQVNPAGISPFQENDLKKPPLLSSRVILILVIICKTDLLSQVNFYVIILNPVKLFFITSAKK